MREEYDILNSEFETLREEYWNLCEIADQEQWGYDSTTDETDTPETPDVPANLQTFSYVSSVDGCLDFSITYDGDILSVEDSYNTPSVQVTAHRDIENPRAYMHVRAGSWEDHYDSPYSRYDLDCDVTEVSEASPLSINGYDGYYWSVYIEETAINWNNDVYIFAIQLDSEHYFYVESSRITLENCCTFEELLTNLIYDIQMP